MQTMKRLTLIICCMIMLVLTVAACIGNARVQPSANDFMLTAEAKLPIPTFAAGEPFECWTAPAPKATDLGTHSKGKLLLVFSVIRKDLLSLYQFDLATQKYSLLASPIDALFGSPISPDGNYLAYQRRTAPVGFITYVHRFADSTTRQVPVLVGASEVWSPDGQCLLIWRDQNTAFAYRLADGALQKRSWPTISGQLSGEFSPDGKWWAWSCEKSVCLMNPDARATGHTTLSLPISVDLRYHDPNTAYYNPSMLWWSPSSQVLAIAYPGRDWQYRDALRLVVIDQTGGTSFRDVVVGKEGGIDEVRWAPDSSQVLITYLSGKTDLYNLHTEKLMPLPSPEGYPRLSVAPAWSPTGQQIAFMAQEQHSLYIMDADGTNVTLIPSLPPDAPGADALAPDYRIDQIYWVP